MLVEADNAADRGLTSPQRDRQQPPVSLPSFSFCDLPQDGLGEHAEVRPLWGATVCRPVCAALHRNAEICRHRGKDENICATPWWCQHGLLADCGLLRCLRHLYCPGDLGTPEVHGLCEEEVPHWEEEVVSFSGVSTGLQLRSQCSCDWDQSSWWKSEPVLWLVQITLGW